MPHKILVDVPLPDTILDLIDSAYNLHTWSENPDPAVLAHIEGVFTYGHLKIDAALMDRAPGLKVVSTFGVGVDHIDLNAARERGISVGNTPSILDGATADMAFALLLSAARNIVIGDRYARSPEFTHFDPSILLGLEVHGQTLGIVGLGNIGRQIARRAIGFNMPVLYHNRKPNPQAETELGATYVSLSDLLGRSDYVVLSVPLTDETRGMIGAEELALMKPTAILVNVARGGVVDHDALLDTLRNRRIALAAVDVTEPEPLPRDHPLLGLDNLVIAPHLGSATIQTRRAMARLSVDNLRAGLEGRALPSRVA